MHTLNGADAAAEIEKWKLANAGVFTYVSHSEVTFVPADRTFRNAWKPDLTVDMPKAISIQTARLKAQAVIDAKEQEIADVAVSADVAKAKTPEELKGLK